MAIQQSIWKKLKNWYHETTKDDPAAASLALAGTIGIALQGVEPVLDLAVNSSAWLASHFAFLTFAAASPMLHVTAAIGFGFVCGGLVNVWMNLDLIGDLSEKLRNFPEFWASLSKRKSALLVIGSMIVLTSGASLAVVAIAMGLAAAPSYPFIVVLAGLGVAITYGAGEIDTLWSRIKGEKGILHELYAAHGSLAWYVIGATIGALAVLTLGGMFLMSVASIGLMINPAFVLPLLLVAMIPLLCLEVTQAVYYIDRLGLIVGIYGHALQNGVTSMFSGIKKSLGFKTAASSQSGSKFKLHKARLFTYQIPAVVNGIIVNGALSSMIFFSLPTVTAAIGLAVVPPAAVVSGIVALTFITGAIGSYLLAQAFILPRCIERVKPADAEQKELMAGDDSSPKGKQSTTSALRPILNANNTILNLDSSSDDEVEADEKHPLVSPREEIAEKVLPEAQASKFKLA